MMSNALSSIFPPVFRSWLEMGQAPEASSEGVSPEFTGWLGGSPTTITFDQFKTLPESGWGWRSIDFPEIFDGLFYFYLPVSWNNVALERAGGKFGDAQQFYIQLFLIPGEYYQAEAARILEAERLVAFMHRPQLQPSYHQWVYVTCDPDDIVSVHSIYSAGEWYVAAKGQTHKSQKATLSDLLTFAVLSNPWSGWLEAAKKGGSV